METLFTCGPGIGKCWISPDYPRHSDRGASEHSGGRHYVFISLSDGGMSEAGQCIRHLGGGILGWLVDEVGEPYTGNISNC